MIPIEIFKLFGSIFVDNTDANKKIDETGRKSEGLSGIFEKIGGFAAGVGKAAAAGTAIAGTALTGIAVKALKLGGDLEQSVGGVETLFKDSADTVIKNAEKAYLTAGVNANDYMQQVTSFSASLLQSLGGDTEAAAKAADTAIIDMADNANKMGTSIGSIQNAYQGFAKQNYTMLDNLKLGYGGTKTEMERLLADAEKLSGVKYDISNLGDVYQAIHVIQEELGITGTTAKEGMETLQGSFSTAKAALDNFLSGAGNIDDVISSSVNLAGIVAERLAEIIPRLANELPKVFTALEPLLPPMFDTLLPAIFEGAAKLIAGLAQGIISNLPMILEAAQSIALAILEGFGDVVPIVQPVTDALSFLIEHLDAVMAVIIPLTAAVSAYKAAMAITAIIDGASKAIKAWQLANEGATIAQYALNLAMSLNPIGLVVAAVAALAAGIIYLWNTNEDFRSALINAWETIKTSVSAAVAAVTGFFTGLADFLKNNWKEVLAFIVNPIEGALKLLYKLNPEFKEWVDGLIAKIRELPGKIGAYFEAVVQKFKSWIDDMKKKAKALIPEIIENIAVFFEELPGKALEWGKGLIDGFINGIKSKIAAVGSAVNDVMSTVSDYIGFHSPAKKGEGRYIVEWGSNMIGGFSDGVKKALPKLEGLLNNALALEASSFNSVITSEGNAAASAVMQSPASFAIPQEGGGLINNYYFNVTADVLDSAAKVAHALEDFAFNRTAFGGV